MSGRWRTKLRVAHIVRSFGNLTEPFIEQRVQSGSVNSIVWYETTSRPVAESCVRVRPWPPGLGRLLSAGFHRLPPVALACGVGYRAAEAKSRPDVIHAHYLTTATMAAVHTKAPMIASAYGYDISAIANRVLWRDAYVRLSRRVSRVLVEGPHMAERAMELGFQPWQIAIVPISVDTTEMEFRPLEAPVADLLMARPIRLASCGRLVEKKGHDTAIRAFSALREQLPAGSTLDVVGGGRLEIPLRRLVGELGLDEAVRFHGALSRMRYLELLSQSDLLVVASRTARNGDSEGGAPTTILDAQACGVPVVATNHADIPFLVSDGETGYPAAGIDVGALVSLINRALASMSDWPAVLKRARAQVESRHSLEALSRNLDRIYKEVAQT